MPATDLPARIARTLVEAYSCPEAEADAVRAIRTVAACSAANGVGEALVERRMEYWRQRLPGALWSLATLEDALDDLAGALRERRIWRVGRIVSAVAQHWNVLLGFAGLLAGVAVYTVSLGYDRYYGALGLDPEDVGVGPAAVLGRSALGTALFTAVGAAVLIAFVAPLGAAIAPMLERQARQLPGGCAKAVALRASVSSTPPDSRC